MAATVPVVVAPALGPHHRRPMLVYALLALAILIALLDTGNTPAQPIFERELGVMRAVGMTRPQLRATIRWGTVALRHPCARQGMITRSHAGQMITL